MTSIYLAGKIGKNDWRHDIVGLRGAWADNNTGESPTDAWPVLGKGVARTFDYTGPYFISDDHGCAHGDNSHGCGDEGGICGGAWPSTPRSDLVRRCLDAIDRSDIVFAWLDDPTAYGTLVEIGYAVARKKLVIIGTSERPGHYERRYVPRYQEIQAPPWRPGPSRFEDLLKAAEESGLSAEDHEETAGWRHDVWFAFTCGLVVVAPDPLAAVQEVARKFPNGWVAEERPPGAIVIARPPAVHPDLVAQAIEQGSSQSDLTNVVNAEGRLLVSLRNLRTGRHSVFGDFGLNNDQAFMAEQVRVSVIFDAAGYAALLKKFHPERARQIDIAFDILLADVVCGETDPYADRLLDLPRMWWVDPEEELMKAMLESQTDTPQV